MRAARIVSVVLVCAAAPAAADTFDVGEGQSYANIGDVPWESLNPGDVVQIHWRAAPYQEKWVIGRSGTESQPIVVRGVAGPGGERPVIDGRDATTRTQLSYTNEERGVIKIGSSNTPADTLPAWIVIEGLDVRSGRPPYAYTGDDASAGSYVNNAAAIYVEKAQDLVIRDNVLHDSGNGLFIGAFDGQTRRIRVEGNYIYDNGNVGSAFEHNSYTAAIDIVFEGNHYGPLRDGCDGNNLKDRSAGLVVRYNWIESGNRQLDLVDAEDSAVLVNHPSYGTTFVYGNVLVEHDGDGNSQIVHYGGDSGTVADYRKGTLHFYNNTIVSTRGGNTTLFRLSTNEETADARNNIVVATAGADRLAMLDETGGLELRHNCMAQGWVDSHGSLAGTITDDGTGIGGDPAFLDPTSQDYRLSATSPCRDQATQLAAGAMPVASQYVRHQMVEPRPDDGSLDVGAFEYCDPGACTPETPDAGPVTGDDGGAGGGDGGSGNGDPGGGCGCATGARTGGSPIALLAFAALVALRGRRRRSR